jgi:hypothetical protein
MTQEILIPEKMTVELADGRAVRPMAVSALVAQGFKIRIRTFDGGFAIVASARRLRFRGVSSFLLEVMPADITSK